MVLQNGLKPCAVVMILNLGNCSGPTIQKYKLAPMIYFCVTVKDRNNLTEMPKVDFKSADNIKEQLNSTYRDYSLDVIAKHIYVNSSFKIKPL